MDKLKKFSEQWSLEKVEDCYDVYKTGECLSYQEQIAIVVNILKQTEVHSEDKVSYAYLARWLLYNRRFILIYDKKEKMWKLGEFIWKRNGKEAQYFREVNIIRIVHNENGYDVGFEIHKEEPWDLLQYEYTFYKR